MNGYKETEIGTIPAEWKVLPLRKVATFSRKPRALRLSEYQMIPFFPMEVLPENGILAKEYEPKTASEIGSGTYIERGDILLAKITPSFENGKQAIVENIPTPFAYATTEVYPFHPSNNKQLDRMFLFYYFKLSNVRVDIAGKMEGTTGRQRVPKAVLENYPIPLPPINEQRRIAAVLTTIQQAIAAQEQVIQAAREVKRSLMHRLFTYGPYAEERPAKETVIGNIPEYWELFKLSDPELDISDGNYAAKYPRKSDFVATGIPFIRANNMKEGKIVWADMRFITPAKHAELQKGHLKENDILITTRGNLGELAYVTSEFHDCNINAQIVRIDSSNVVDQRFFFYALSHEPVNEQFRRFGTGTALKQLPIGKLKMIKVPKPPEIEQIIIAKKLTALDRKVQTEISRKSALEVLFKSMLHQLMTGQIRIKESSDG